MLLGRFVAWRKQGGTMVFGTMVSAMVSAARWFMPRFAAAISQEADSQVRDERIPVSLKEF